MVLWTAACVEHLSLQSVRTSITFYMQIDLSFISGGDGCLCRWSIMDALHSHTLVPSQQCTLASPPVHIVSVSCDYFVIVGVASKGTQLSIWDISYLTNQGSSMLSDHTPSLHHVTCCVCGYVVVCGRDCVTLVSTRERTNYGTLAAALGRGQSSTAVRLSENSGTGATSVRVRLKVSLLLTVIIMHIC